MNTITDKLAEALRALGDSIRFTPLGVGPLKSLAVADAALAEYEAVRTDPTRALVLRDALRDYASAQYVAARDLRDASKRHEWDYETRERFAQGADWRHRVALEMAEEMEARA